MPPEVIIVCPELGGGGVGDYTLRIAGQWQSVRPRFVVATPPGERVEYEVEQLRGPLPRGDRLLLQYSAYGFNHYGYPRTLLRALVDWKRETQGVLVIMFHEIWTFWPLLNKNRPLQFLHRRDIGTLARAADAVFTSTHSQSEHLRDASGRADVQVLPVGSNIQPTARLDGSKQPGVAVLFGLQASRLSTLRKMREHLAAPAASGAISKLVLVGGGNTSAGDAEERGLAGALQLRDGVDFRGALPEHAVSELLASASFAISAQDELSVTKSGTFIAYAAHGLNIISPYAAASAAEPLCWATHPAELQTEDGARELQARAQSLRGWHDRTCSWPRIAEEFARALRLNVPQSMTAERALP